MACETDCHWDYLRLKDICTLVELFSFDIKLLQLKFPTYF